MTDPDAPGLADAYWNGEDWAFAQVSHLVSRGGPEAVALLEVLAHFAPDEDVLGSLGAGPLEDLVNWHGFGLMDELDAALNREPRLRIAVGTVRVGIEQLPPDIVFRRFYLSKEADS